ncbi:hypothetical protein B0H63DRAFT_523569 [Podospora didyma]|uniref:Arrestin-like N-terminal domain-containing protein n=1 Tax=Podospora didyma TaxID=330526 RepID=A0AAE0TV71_9PEZI|nr:hypothetical protein B0H63DRAFT_523569 [Podospora didyma]
MPRRKHKGNERLSIHLNSPQAFKAGVTPRDVLSGKVTRLEHAVSPRACLVVQIVGSIGVAVDDGQKIHRTYGFDFLGRGPDKKKAVTIFDGVLHIPRNSPDGVSWPFSLRIPTSAGHALGPGSPNAGTNGFFSPVHAMATGSLLEAYIWEQKHQMYGGGLQWKKTASARVPIVAKPTVNLTIKECVLELFKSSRAPRYAFNVVVAYPDVVKLILSPTSSSGGHGRGRDTAASQIYVLFQISIQPLGEQSTARVFDPRLPKDSDAAGGHLELVHDQHTPVVLLAARLCVEDAIPDGI